MKATNNAAPRRRNQVASFLSRATLALFGGIAWGCMATYAELGNRLYALAGLACLLLAALPSLSMLKGGRR